MRKRIKSTIAVVGVCALTLVACSGGKSGKASDDWDPAGSTAARATAARISHAFPGQCADFSLLQRSTYVSSSAKIHSPIPIAAGSCDALGESIEISAFRDDSHRTDFVNERGQILCSRAHTIGTDLPGLRWVVGPKVSIQTDSEGAAQRIAEQLGYTYKLTACPGRTNVDWNDTDVARINGLAESLKNAGLGCADLQLLDRDLLSHNPHYRQIGLPGAYANCTIGTDPGAVVASFRHGTAKLTPFLQAELVDICTQSKAARAVVGPDWYVELEKGEDVAKVASLLHGTVGPGCS